MPKKKIDIFNLYKYEKKVSITDPYGNTAEIILRKPTSGQQREASRFLESQIERYKAEISARDGDDIRKNLSLLPRDRLNELILSLEIIYIEDIADLAPTEDAARSEYKIRRTEELSKEKDDTVLAYATNLSIESRAKLSAIADYNRYILCLSCLDPDSKNQLFSINPEDKNCIDNLDQAVINTLSQERLSIMTAETKGDVRRAAKDPNFT